MQVMWITVSLLTIIGNGMSEVFNIPGGMLEAKGKLHAVQDYLYLNLSLHKLEDVPQLLFDLQQRTVGIITVLDNIPINNSSDDQTLIAIIKQKTNLTLTLVEDSLNLLTPNQTQHRQKRGLINGLGIISKYLFGTATEGDICELNDRILNLNQIVQANGKVMDLEVLKLSQQNEKINQIINVMNKLKGNLDTFTRTADIFKISLVLDNVILETREIKDLVVNQLNDISLVAQNIIPVSLITPQQLYRVLDKANKQYSLHSIFKYRIMNYYKVMRSYFDHNTIVIDIPLTVEHDEYLVYNFLPFPSLINDTPVILTEVPMNLAVSNNTLTFTNLSSELLDTCSIFETEYLCDSSLLLWQINPQSCIPQTIFSLKSMQNHCKLINYTGDVVTHHTQTSVLIFFPKLLPITHSCRTGSLQKTTVSFKKGRYILKGPCTISTPTHKITASSNHHVQLTLNHSFLHLQEVTFSINWTSSIEVITPLEPINYMDLHSTWSTLTTTPTGIVSSMSMTLVVIMIVILIFFIKFWMKRPRLIVHKAQL